MNIQIFGSKKDFDTKKAERYFKERGIKAQFIDMKEKGCGHPVDDPAQQEHRPSWEARQSKGEFNSVCHSVGGYQIMIDQNCKGAEGPVDLRLALTRAERRKDLLALVTYIAEGDLAEKILENQKIIKTPIVRNGKLATVGYQPDIWKGWK